jgi:predicted DNA-binding ribbon-helix-helix protein
MRERTTKSAIIKHSISLGGHRTSVSLESEFWKAARDIAEERHETVPRLLTSIDAGRQHANLSSAIRLFVLSHYQQRLALGRSRVGPSIPSTFNRKRKPAGDSSRKGSLSDTDEPAAHDETPTSGSKS